MPPPENPRSAANNKGGNIKSIRNPNDSGCNVQKQGIAVHPVKDDMIASVDRASQFLKALAGRSRLLLLCHLWEGEKSVGELARLTDARDTAVSQQLALLRREGMVRARRAGQMIYYSLASEDVVRMLEALDALFVAPANVDGPQAVQALEDASA